MITMSEQGLPVATNTLSKKDNNAVDVYHTSCQCYFRPETGEIIFISESDSGEFDNLTYKLSRLMDVLDKARNEYSIALQEYYNKRRTLLTGNSCPDILMQWLHRKWQLKRLLTLSGRKWVNLMSGKAIQAL